jgi:hypothetical protein
MKRRKFIWSALAGAAAITSTGIGLPLSGCGKEPSAERTDHINNANTSFAPYPHDPVRAENFTNPLFIPGGEGPFGVLLFSFNSSVRLVCAKMAERPLETFTDLRNPRRSVL